MDCTAALHPVAAQLDRFARGLDPDRVGLSDAAGLWRLLDRIERQAAACKTLLARRVEQSGVANRSQRPHPLEK